MKEQVHDMFFKITMPEETEAKIRAAILQHGRKSRRTLWRSLITAAAMVALVLVISPRARATFDRWIVKYVWSDSDITIYEERNEEGEVVATIAAVDTETPPFARMENGRLYFVGNGETIDITDHITEDSPYYYSYEDVYGFTHEMVVGYSGTIEKYGVYEFIWKEENGEKTWTTGTGRNFLDPETETRYPWVDLVWQKLNIPWPMPE